MGLWNSFIIREEKKKRTDRNGLFTRMAVHNSAIGVEIKKKKEETCFGK